MIKGNENIKTIAEHYPELIGEFQQHGMGSYFKPENLDKMGRFMILSTLLKSKKMDAAQFIASLNKLLNEQKKNSEFKVSDQHSLHLMAMLPCGLRNPFKEFLEKHITEHPDEYAGLNYLAEGNVNHELSYYPLLDNISSIDELPDIIIASDVNNFFHRPFIDKFLSKGVFETYMPYQPNDYLEKVGFADPNRNYTMITSNMLVMVIDKERLGSSTVPKRWADLLSPEFENEIIMRGEDNFFCNAVMLPFCKDIGFGAIKILAKNIKSGKHPAEMVKLAGSGKDEAAKAYIMPYFFAQRIQSPNVEVVWPEDGAIASPVFMLVKKEKAEKHQQLLDFLMGAATGQMLAKRHFPSMHPDIDHSTFPKPIKWLGWEFLSNNDIGKLKADIQDVFMEVWNKKNK